MNWEHYLICRILADKNMRDVVKSGITSDFFEGVDNRERFNYLHQQYSAHGGVPSVDMMQENFPDFEYVEPGEDLGILIAHIKDSRAYNDVQTFVSELMTVTRADVQEGLNLIKSKASYFSLVHSESNDIDITKMKNTILQEYYNTKQNKMLGIPYPWDKLNEATMGMHNGEFILYVGRPGTMKTWLMLASAMHAHTYHAKRILLMSAEMSLEQMRRRATAYYCGLDYEKYLRGELDPEQEANFNADVQAMEQTCPILIADCQSKGMEAVTEFRAKIEEYDVDVAFFDGIYLLSNDTKELIKITRAFKHLAKAVNIPIVGTAQVNRQGENSRGTSLAEIAYSDSFGQDADMVIRIIREEHHEQNQEIFLTLPKFREGKPVSFTINAKPATDFSQKDGRNVVAGFEDGAILEEENDGEIN